VAPKELPRPEPKIVKIEPGAIPELGSAELMKLAALVTPLMDGAAKALHAKSENSAMRRWGLGIKKGAQFHYEPF
jgi:hypothetical protein